MSFDAIEISNSDGRPITLFEFQRGGGLLYWRYTNADRDVVHGSNTYTAIAIKSGGFTQSGSSSQDSLEIAMPHDVSPAKDFKGVVPSDTIWLTIREMHFGPYAPDGDAIVTWVGSIAEVKSNRPNEALVIARTLAASLERTGLRLGYSRQCPHMLYDAGCKIAKEAHALAATVTAVTATTVSADEFASLPDGRLAAGYLEWEIAPGVFERRPIESHTGDTVTALGLVGDLAVDTPVTAYPGCARTAQYCHDVFNNLANYGGFPHLPGKSPFDGNLVF